MPSLCASVMQTLYGTDIYAGFSPSADATVQGWNGDHPSLARLTQSIGPKLIVDVGVWKGQSTINMAMAMKRASIDGCVIAVDTFLGSPEHWDAGLFARINGLPDLYHTFLSNVVRAGVAEYVVPMAQTSTTAAMILARNKLSPSLVHIDSAHEYEEVIRDAKEYYSILQPGGFIVGDDYHYSWPGVVKAAAEFSMIHSLPLTIDVPKWIVQKPATSLERLS